MIDIHSHIIPYMDDGAADMDEALAMARMAVAEGITRIIVTPHHANGQYNNPAGTVNQAVEELRLQLAKHHIPLTLYPGQEIRLYSRLIEDWEGGLLLPLAQSPYILIEFPSARVPERTKEYIHELQMLGLIPVLAHPERNKELMNHPGLLRELVDSGVRGQVTTHSLTGSFGKAIQKAAFGMCREGLIHFVASDAHNIRQRPFAMQEAYRRITEELGAEWTSYYQRNAQSLLQGEPIQVQQQPVPSKRKSFLANLFKPSI